MSVKHFAMKVPFFLTLALACSMAHSQWAQPSRFALLVGVGDYPAETGWSKLSSRNDVRLVKEVLAEHGFANKNVTTLLDREASSEEILKAIRTHLTEKSRPGGIAVFQFSGHGQQVQDDNGDEIDGLDEALVPYNSPMRYAAGKYEGENLLRDDQLGEALLAVRRKLGPKGTLLVLIDACHSGTATRGSQVVARGTDIVMASPEYLQKLAQYGRDDSRLQEAFMPREEHDLAPMIALFSSSPNQLSYEIKDGNGDTYGSFTYAFCKALQQTPPDGTWRSLMDRIKQEVSALNGRQNPVAEGQIDRVVFGEGLRPAPDYYSVLKAYSEDSLILIDAGQLQGINPRCKVALYPPGTIDTSAVAPLAFGIVEGASPIDADVHLDRQLKKRDVQTARVFLLERSYGDLAARMHVNLTNPEMAELIRKRLAPFEFIEVVGGEAADLFLEEAPGLAGAGLRLYQDGDKLLWEGPALREDSPDLIANSLLPAVERYLRANYLRKLEHPYTRYEAEIRILLKTEDGKFDPMHNLRPLKPGRDTIKIQVWNRGSASFYFQLYDIQPDHKITTIVPYRRPASDYFLAPGAFFEFPAELTIEPPAGIDVLKIIATPKPLDINLTRSRGGYSNNPLEALACELISSSRIRGETPSLPLMIGYIGSLVYEVEE
jgi:metacaspase-1